MVELTPTTITTTSNTMDGAAATGAAQHSVICVLLCKTLHCDSIITFATTLEHIFHCFSYTGPVSLCAYASGLSHFGKLSVFSHAFSPRWVSID
jgi:hypothetical protein